MQRASGIKIEIERKFLVLNDSWKATASQRLITRQGYIPNDHCTLRARRMGDQGFLTIKNRKSARSSEEFEVEIPSCEADRLIDSVCAFRLDKVRYLVPHGIHTWEVDVFRGNNAGLMVAEIELGHENEPFEIPPWAGEEVTADVRYRNVYLSQVPWQTWASVMADPD